MFSKVNPLMLFYFCCLIKSKIPYVIWLSASLSLAVEIEINLSA